MNPSQTTSTDAIIELLACPVTGSQLYREGNELVSRRGGLRYPIREGIPVLLASAAVAPEGADPVATFTREWDRP